MAAIPSASETVVDPGLGIVGAVSTTPAVVGTTSSGTANVAVKVATQKKLTDTYGEGPGVEAASHILATGGGPVLVVRTSTTQAASNGAVTQSGGGPLITLSGDAVIDANCRVEILSGGALGTATFRYSLDTFSGDEASDRTYSGSIVVPAGGTYAIPTLGVTITFPAGTYVADEFYTFTVNCAAANATDIGTAMDALDATAFSWRFAYIVTSNNTTATAADHVLIAAQVQTKLNAMAVSSKYRAAIMATDMDDADPISDWTSPAYDRIMPVHGRIRSVSPKGFIGHAFPVVPGATSFAARAAGSLISTDLKRVPGNGLNNGGPLPNVVKIFVDERVDSTGVDDIKLSTLRTYLGRPGFYITQGRIKSAAGSDFTVWPRRIVMDVACEVAHAVQETFIGRGIRTNNDGTIDERDALRLEEEVQTALEAALLSPRNAEGTGGHVSALAYQISRLNDVQATSTIEATVAIKPLTYPDYITADVSFVASIGAVEPTPEEA